MKEGERLNPSWNLALDTRDLEPSEGQGGQGLVAALAYDQEDRMALNLALV